MNFSPFLIDQLWKLNSKTLSNKKVRKWQSKDQWCFKEHGDVVYIENKSTNKVLTVLDDNNTVEEEILEKDNPRQLWNKQKQEKSNKDGYHFLMNTHSKMFLSAKSTNGFEIKKGTSLLNRIVLHTIT